MRGETLGRRVLGLDALYCAAGGAVAIVGARPLASFFGVPTPLVAALGAGAIAWAALVRLLARRPEWRRAVALVAAVNIVAALAFFVVAAAAPRLAAQALLVAVAAEVLAFGGLQAVAVRRG